MGEPKTIDELITQFFRYLKITPSGAETTLFKKLIRELLAQEFQRLVVNPNIQKETSQALIDLFNRLFQEPKA